MRYMKLETHCSKRGTYRSSMKRGNTYALPRNSPSEHFTNPRNFDNALWTSEFYLRSVHFVKINISIGSNSVVSWNIFTYLCLHTVIMRCFLRDVLLSFYLSYLYYLYLFISFTSIFSSSSVNLTLCPWEYNFHDSICFYVICFISRMRYKDITKNEFTKYNKNRFGISLYF